jgi:hypothetical protein
MGASLLGAEMMTFFAPPWIKKKQIHCDSTVTFTIHNIE